VETAAGAAYMCRELRARRASRSETSGFRRVRGRRDHAGGEGRQLQKVSTVQGQILDRLLLDDLPDGGCVGIQQDGRTLNRDLLVDLADFEFQIGAGRLVYEKFDIRDYFGLEAG